jgi:hypothetical protein
MPAIKTMAKAVRCSRGPGMLVTGMVRLLE